MKKVDLYTDGACSGNPGVGGWGVVLIYKGHIKELSGYFDYTTNNRMELFSIIQGLKSLKEKCEVTVYSDSAYAVDSFNKGWVRKWESNGWKTGEKEPVKNKDLWTDLLLTVEKHDVTFIKVKGHSDNLYNNRCDEMARAEIKKCRSL
ncbi:MAG: ribonuclease HI [Clostridia bacterium]|jgi:Ribonuclease HI|nr:ribonuclease HI [Clostridia bacterium]